LSRKPVTTSQRFLCAPIQVSQYLGRLYNYTTQSTSSCIDRLKQLKTTVNVRELVHFFEDNNYHNIFNRSKDDTISPMKTRYG